jgi:hypothetical protein
MPGISTQTRNITQPPSGFGKCPEQEFLSLSMYCNTQTCGTRQLYLNLSSLLLLLTIVLSAIVILVELGTSSQRLGPAGRTEL